MSDKVGEVDGEANGVNILVGVNPRCSTATATGRPTATSNTPTHQ